MSEGDQERLLEKFKKKNKELEKQQAGLSHDTSDLRTAAGDQPSAATLSAAAGFSVGGGTSGDCWWGSSFEAGRRRYGRKWFL